MQRKKGKWLFETMALEHAHTHTCIQTDTYLASRTNVECSGANCTGTGGSAKRNKKNNSFRTDHTLPLGKPVEVKCIQKWYIDAEIFLSAQQSDTFISHSLYWHYRKLKNKSSKLRTYAAIYQFMDGYIR